MSLFPNPDAQEDVMPIEPGIHYDADRQTWYFYGQIDRHEQYEIPGAIVDLARVRYWFVNEESMRVVWVALGMQITYGREHGYLTRGPWINTTHAQRWASLDSIVRVSVSSHGIYESPTVSEDGVDWSTCLEQFSCQIASSFDQQHLDLSNRFIETGRAPGWYPWGFLFWYVDVFEGDFIRMIRGEDENREPVVMIERIQTFKHWEWR